MFVLNGVSFAGQMLVPIYLTRQCGIPPARTGLLMAPLGLGMMCAYPLTGVLTARFGIRRLAAAGALLALVGTLPLPYMAGHDMLLPVLAISLFVRGAGMSAIGIPSITSGYASVRRQDLPMATTAMNIVQRLGGPTLTTLCATFLGWRLGSAPAPATVPNAFVAAFALLCVLQGLLFLAVLKLPRFAGLAGTAATTGGPRLGRGADA